jgi:glycosyltransferase involved in cell wall biosynthesis
MEKVTVIIPTYNRPEILKDTINRIAFNLVYDGVVDICIGNDGDRLPHISDIHTRDSVVNVYVLDGPKRGLGANLNMLIKATDSELILQMDDDHYLERPLNINQYAEQLLKNQIPHIDWIRLFLGTEEDLNNDDPFYKFRAYLWERYWVLNPWEGPELYLPSNRPHIKNKNFHRKIGMYQEGLKLGETETEFCSRYLDYMQDDTVDDEDQTFVAIPVAAPSFDTWKHVGDSWQKQGL